LDDDIEAYADIKTELREEAERFGDVTNVTLFDKEVDGIATVRFRDFESAEKFRKKCNGRLFARRELEVTIAEEKPKFRKSARGGDSSDEDRLEKVAQA
jgi:HIV Tat-specific factor 1